MSTLIEAGNVEVSVATGWCLGVVIFAAAGAWSNGSSNSL